MRSIVIRITILLGLFFPALCLVASPALAAKTYSDNGDGTVTDPTTGLTWMRCSMGQTWNGTNCVGAARTYTWSQATGLVGTVTFAGQSDWRLPNIRELLTTIDFGSYAPATDQTVFPSTSIGGYYWSNSGDAKHGFGYYWIAALGVGAPWSTYGRSYDNYVRLVRGGQNPSALLDTARPAIDYVYHGDGTVTHLPTGLIWQQCAVGQTWDSGSCVGQVSTLSSTTRASPPLSNRIPSWLNRAAIDHEIGLLSSLCITA